MPNNKKTRPELITVVLQVHNEEEHITDAIKSARLLTTSILVMDMQSTDNTAELALKNGAQIKSAPFYEYVEPIRQLAFTQTTAEWIFLLDADERITPALASEIIETVSQESSYAAYRVKRKNIFAGKKWFRHGGWWPDSQLRLIKRRNLIAWPERIHSTPQIDGTTGMLKEPFLHLFHGDLTKMVQKTAKFEDQEAALLYKAGRKTSVFTFGRKFLGELFRRLIRKQGYRDGTYGIIESIYQAYSKTITWLLVAEKNYQRDNG